MLQHVADGMWVHESDFMQSNAVVRTFAWKTADGSPDTSNGRPGPSARRPR